MYPITPAIHQFVVPIPNAPFFLMAMQNVLVFRVMLKVPIPFVDALNPVILVILARVDKVPFVTVVAILYAIVLNHTLEIHSEFARGQLSHRNYALRDHVASMLIVTLSTTMNNVFVDQAILEIRTADVVNLLEPLANLILVDHVLIVLCCQMVEPHVSVPMATEVIRHRPPDVTDTNAPSTMNVVTIRLA